MTGNPVMTNAAIGYVRRLGNLEALKDWARHRREQRAAKERLGQAKVLLDVRGLWKEVLDQVVKDHPVLQGHLDENPPKEWLEIDTPGQIDTAPVCVELPGHTRITAVYQRYGELADWKHGGPDGGPVWHVDTQMRTMVRTNDLGEALLVAEEQCAAKQEAKKRAEALAPPPQEMDPAAKLTSALQEFIEWCQVRWETAPLVAPTAPESLNQNLRASPSACGVSGGS